MRGVGIGNAAHNIWRAEKIFFAMAGGAVNLGQLCWMRKSCPGKIPMAVHALQFAVNGAVEAIHIYFERRPFFGGRGVAHQAALIMFGSRRQRRGRSASAEKLRGKQNHHKHRQLTHVSIATGQRVMTFTDYRYMPEQPAEGLLW
jgi:hypothetical protein